MRETLPLVATNRAIASMQMSMTTVAAPARVASWRSVAPMTPTSPPTARLLKMLLPKMLPIISSFMRRRLAAAAVTNSGRDVPAATSVRPTKPEPRSRAWAISCAPSTISCALAIVPPKPMISQSMSRRGRCVRGVSEAGVSWGFGAGGSEVGGSVPAEVCVRWGRVVRAVRA